MGPYLGDHPGVLVLIGVRDHISRLLSISHHASYSELHGGGRSQLRIDIRTIIILVVAVIVVVGLTRKLFQKTVLVKIADGNEILYIVASSRDVDIVTALEKHIVETVVLPVHARIHYRIGACPVGFDSFAGKIKLPVGDSVELLLDVPETCKLVASRLLDKGNGLLQAHRGAHRHFRLAAEATTRGHKDDSVGSTYSIYSRT